MTPDTSDDDEGRVRRHLDEFVDGLRAGRVTAASAAGADFSTVLISASGNRGLQTHVDLLVARTLRLLALTTESDHWTIWVDGYRDTLALLDAGDRPGALARYRHLYADVRAALLTMEFESP